MTQEPNSNVRNGHGPYDQQPARYGGGVIIPISPEELTHLIQESVRRTLESFDLDATSKQSESGEENAYLTRKETAQRLRISLVTLRAMEKRGELIPRRLGRKVIYLSDEISTAMMRRAA